MKTLERPDFVPLKQISVLLAEDHAKVRKFLKLSVEADGDIEVIGEAKNGRQAVHLSRSLRPEVIVMDIAMPVLNGLRATQEIMNICPLSRVLILSAHPDPAYIMQAMVSGASGYLIKQSSTQVLAQAIREVLIGNTYFSTSIAKHLCDQCRKVFTKAELLKRKSARSRPTKP